MFVKSPIAAAIFVLSSVAAGAASADVFHVTIEAPGVQSSTSVFTTKGVETFDGRSLGGNQNFQTDFGLGGGQISGTYSGVDIMPAAAWGGAGGAGNYGATFFPESFSLALSGTTPINYFGYWLSALDSGNFVTFWKDGNEVFTFNPDDVLTAIDGSSAYNSNPNFPAGQEDPEEQFVFVNFYDTTGTFDRVTFSQGDNGAGYESDNHTVGFYTQESGTLVGAVPEPSTYAMLLAGLAGIGFAARRRKA